MNPIVVIIGIVVIISVFERAYRRHVAPAPATLPTPSHWTDPYARIRTWILARRGGGSGIIGYVLTIVLVALLATIVWWTWDRTDPYNWVHDEVYLRAFDKDAYDCLNPADSEELKQCLADETAEDKEKAEMNAIREQWEKDPNSIVVDETPEPAETADPDPVPQGTESDGIEIVVVDELP